MTTALIPGSFDPLTNGHVDVIERSCGLFERVVVAIVTNPSKASVFSAEERMRFIGDAFGERVEVSEFDGLLVDFARAAGADCIVKGLRSTVDFDYEQQMAQMNRHVAGVDTMFLATRPELSFVSSSLVKEVAKLGGDIDALVPEPVARALKERYG